MSSAPGLSKADQAVRNAMLAMQAGNLEQSQNMLRRVLTKHPMNPRANHVMGIIYFQQGHAEQALYYFEQAIKANPNIGAPHQARGNMLYALERHQDAIQAHNRAIELEPNSYLAHNSLGLDLIRVSDYAGAESAFKMAVQCAPNQPEPKGNLSMLYMNMGRPNEAAQLLEQTIAQHPNHIGLRHQLASIMNYATTCTPEQIFQAHQAYGQLLTQAQPTPKRQFPNTPDPHRPIRIGYLSGDLKTHSVAYFLRPILENHNHDRFSIHCYSTTRYPDNTTEELKKLADHWTDYHALDDIGLSKRILADNIDILVELNGQSSGNRLTVLNAKSAPVQVTYLGYPNTTGVAAIDYRIVDNLTDPPDPPDPSNPTDPTTLMVETPYRLPDCFLCYTPPKDAPEPNTLPALETGSITFGSFNNLQKISQHTIELWSRIVAAVPGARLLIKNTALSDKALAADYARRFADAGLIDDQLVLMGRVESTRDHLLVYHKIDLSLDTFPYHGTTTTCEALWMGVPVISQMGAVHASRVGVSLLTNLGLEDFITDSPDAYAEKAIALANDTDRLVTLRASLRNTLKNASLCNAVSFTQDIEQAYQQMWRTWCEQQSNTTEISS